MKFKVSKEVFNKLNDVCFGVVVARGLDNKKDLEIITNLLNKSISGVEEYFKDKNVKESLEISPYRDAFKELGVNPNKFMSSIEAMTSRVAKSKGLPNINPIVDLGNAVSLKYLVPLGAHDIGHANNDICVRFSKNGDKFVPFGEENEEILEDGELIYSIGDEVKTRKWIWRQGEVGKITDNTVDVFFPIDGFKNKNEEKVIQARDELAILLREIFDCKIDIGFIDKNNIEMNI
ncbi:B3/B4 domain-containing protein [Romboutsia sp.]|uniref:B3/B4 domain-containing protein n=1 Tax=Romboutsia sp. TaxID=1965302 RepID=UPI003F37F21B